MKRVLCLLWVLLFVLSACSGSNRAAMADNLRPMAENIDASKEISDTIKAIVDWQLEGSKEYEKQYAKFKESGDEADRPEDNYEEVLAKYDELNAELEKLKGLNDELSNIEPLDEPSYDATTEAAKTYFTELTNAGNDLKAIFDYYIAIHDALLPMQDFSAAENETGLEDYALYAGQLSQVTSQSQKALANVEYPKFMEDSHTALKARIDEYQAFCQDFSIAVQLMDPLRIASCQYRAQRLGIMLDECDQNMTDDFNLQFEQVIKRIDGRIAKLRGELETNIQALQKVVGK